MTLLYDFEGMKETIWLAQVVAERELLVAVLDRAVLDYHGAQCAEFRQSAEEWLFGDSDCSHAFSFCWVCDYLGLCPEKIRNVTKDLDLPMHYAQGHRWLRGKVRSGGRSLRG